MQFTTIPKPLSSAMGDLVYEFSAAGASHDFDVQIIRVTDGAVIAAKRFYGTSSGCINVAPAIRRTASVAPCALPTGFTAADELTTQIAVVADGARSELRHFTTLGVVPDAPQVISSLPAGRTIAYGEQDQIVIYAPEGATATVVASGCGSTEAQSYEIAATANGFAHFCLDSEEFDPEVESFAVAIVAGGELLAELNYLVVTQPAEAWRVAWRSALGVVERYTYPVVTARRVQSQRSGVTLTSGERLTQAASAVEHVGLVSAYEPREVVGAIAEVVGTCDVWHIEGERYTPLEVTTTEVKLPVEASVGYIEIDVSVKYRPSPL